MYRPLTNKDTVSDVQYESGVTYSGQAGYKVYKSASQPVLAFGN